MLFLSSKEISNDVTYTISYNLVNTASTKIINAQKYSINKLVLVFFHKINFKNFPYIFKATYITYRHTCYNRKIHTKFYFSRNLAGQNRDAPWKSVHLQY